MSAIIRADGDALVMHVGERPYVVVGTSTINISTHGLNLDAMTGMLTQLLPADSHTQLEEFGAVEHRLPQQGDDRFTVVAARGGDDIWIEIRRRRPQPAVTAAPDAAPAPPPVAAPEPVIEPVIEQVQAPIEPVQVHAEPEPEPVPEPVIINAQMEPVVVASAEPEPVAIEAAAPEPVIVAAEPMPLLPPIEEVEPVRDARSR